MTSKYILDAVERAKLPISVEYRTYNHDSRRAGARDHFEISWPGKMRTLFAFRDTPESAARVYLDLCASLDPAGPPSAGAAGCSGTFPRSPGAL